jgi:hypothetical protein
MPLDASPQSGAAIGRAGSNSRKCGSPLRSSNTINNLRSAAAAPRIGIEPLDGHPGALTKPSGRFTISK